MVIRWLRSEHPLTHLPSLRTLHTTTAAHAAAKPVLTDQVRTSFLQYYQNQHQHTVLPSSPLIPHNDPSLLFINAGMAPFKHVFTGQSPVQHKRVTTAQLCMRAGGKHNDLDNVGYTRRHHTLFEMLGNFSFFDYYKQQAIHTAWQYVTQVLQLDENRLYVTVHQNDDESARIWSQIAGWSLDSNRIRKHGDTDNHWSMGPTGPCGYCTELFHKHGDVGDVETDDNMLEIWNIVFMSHDRHADGTLHPLPHPCVDTGMGLERIASVLQHKLSNYDIDLFDGILNVIRDTHDSQADTRANSLFSTHNADTTALQRHNSSTYALGLDTSPTATAMRVIADHIRSITFLIADGVLPSNVQRGYVLRRIIRRAVTYGSQIGLNQPFLHTIVPAVVQAMGSTYTHIADNQSRIQQVLRQEELTFYSTLTRGMKALQDKLSTVEQSSRVLSGKDAFLLYDSFGFPLDLTQLLCRQRNVSVDVEDYDASMSQQRQRARNDRDSRGNSNLAVPAEFSVWQKSSIVNEFTGYDTLHELHAKVLAVTQTDNHTYVVITPSPFYAESGGQIGDVGTLTNTDGTSMRVVDCIKAYEHCSVLKLERVDDVDVVNEFAAGVTVHASVDANARQQTAVHHTATHLLHAALKAVLSADSAVAVQQAGSYVGPDKLRFDYSFSNPLTSQQIQQVEQHVNRAALNGTSVTTQLMSLQQAKQMNATALFGEKYGNTVRVVTAGANSVELCGGTHVVNTAQVHPFKIVSESGVASGIRRIEAVAGVSAFDILNDAYTTVKHVAGLLKVPSSAVLTKVTALRDQVDELKDKLVKQQHTSSSTAQAVMHSEYQGTAVQIHTLSDESTIDNNGLRALTAELCKTVPDAVHVLVQSSTGNIALATEPRTTHASVKQMWLILGCQLGGQYTAKGGGNDKLVLGVLTAKGGAKQIELPEMLNKLLRQL